ncbi:MAG: hypothetical protein ACLPRH_07935, partial [Syntrophobacteraceae bacterium]
LAFCQSLFWAPDLGAIFYIYLKLIHISTLKMNQSQNFRQTPLTQAFPQACGTNTKSSEL